jgi:hypothetical protein
MESDGDCLCIGRGIGGLNLRQPARGVSQEQIEKVEKDLRFHHRSELREVLLVEPRLYDHAL